MTPDGDAADPGEAGSPPRPVPGGQLAGRTLGHRPALDGIRGIAIVAVMAFHLRTRRWLPGGFIGVEVFFVLSGFLLTVRLLERRRSPCDGGLRRFYARRLRRLTPALATFLAVWLVMVAAFDHQRWFRGDPFFAQPNPTVSMTTALRAAGLALIYMYNWARERYWLLPNLGHLWFLSVEGQFLVAWPLVLGLASRVRRALLPVTVALTVVSAALPFLLWRHGLGADRVYFGTDTRVQSLLIGAIGAELWVSGAWDHLSQRVNAVFAAGGGLVLIALVLRLHDTSFKYRGGIPLAAIASVGLVTFFTRAGTGRAVAALSHPVILWLGRRSYALYLWHWLFACWTTHWPLWAGTTAALAASCVTAELSWRLVERPLARAGVPRSDARPG